MRSLPRLLGLVCALAEPVVPAAAQGWIEPIRPLPAFPRGAIAKVRSAVHVTVTGRATRVMVEIPSPPCAGCCDRCGPR
jgi:hypothetical protein